MNFTNLGIRTYIFNQNKINYKDLQMQFNISFITLNYHTKLKNN